MKDVVKKLTMSKRLSKKLTGKFSVVTTRHHHNRHHSTRRKTRPSKVTTYHHERLRKDIVENGIIHCPAFTVPLMDFGE